jgi:hypothetical protein
VLHHDIPDFHELVHKTKIVPRWIGQDPTHH